MGKFGDSFKKQLGKNTGNFVSNVLFGNKHATPVRILREEKKLEVEKERAKNTLKLEQKRFENERQLAQERFEHERRLENERLEKENSRHQRELQEKELEIQQENLKQERINTIRCEYVQKLDQLTEFEFPDESDAITKILKKWNLLLRTYSFSGNEEGKEYMNQYMKALQYKYEEGLQKLEQNEKPGSELLFALEIALGGTKADWKGHRKY